MCSVAGGPAMREGQSMSVLNTNQGCGHDGFLGTYKCLFLK